MISERNINLSIDIALHVLILFTFLTVFFFVYVSKLEKQSINNITNNLIKDQTSTFLSKLDIWDKKLNTNIDWKKLDDISQEIKKKYNKEEPQIVENNKKLLKNSIIVIVVFFILLNVVIIYINFFTSYKIHIEHIIITNIIIFSITGLIEFLFFTKVASKYIPVTPEYTSNSVLDRIKYNINK